MDYVLRKSGKSWSLLRKGYRPEMSESSMSRLVVLAFSGRTFYFCFDFSLLLTAEEPLNWRSLSMCRCSKLYLY